MDHCGRFGHLKNDAGYLIFTTPPDPKSRLARRDHSRAVEVLSALKLSTLQTPILACNGSANLPPFLTGSSSAHIYAVRMRVACVGQSSLRCGAPGNATTRDGI